MSTTRYPHVAAAVFDRPWLIQPKAMRAIVEVLEMRLEGGRLTEAEIAEQLAVARRDAGPRSGGRRAGAVAVLPVYGVLSQRANMMTEMSGGTSVEALQRAFREALADPDVSGILLDVDSPGGAAAGVPEFAEEIRAARGRKPIVAVSNSLMASAALWLGVQADELIVAPSSLTGSLGVVMAHEDWSAAEEQAGVKTTLVFAGEHKVETYDTVSLTDDARSYMQSLVDDLHGMFVKAVAMARGVSVAHVQEHFGQGRVLTPRQAVKVGMADRIGTFEDAVARLGTGRVKSRVARLEVTRLVSAEDAEDAPYLEALEDEMLSALEANQGGDARPADDPEANASEEAGTPPDSDPELALAGARSRARRR